MENIHFKELIETAIDAYYKGYIADIIITKSYVYVKFNYTEPYEGITGFNAGLNDRPESFEFYKQDIIDFMKGGL